ncbi:hypothetical protein [Streptomyces sp. NPDC091209]|uniref:hypothetical protein n=1 Tax=Streptomyces sp. NPDC091209 TaxID=3365974 RepID=UPI0038295781
MAASRVGAAPTVAVAVSVVPLLRASMVRPLRHFASSGVVAAHAGSCTSFSRDAYAPP